ncbi:PqqD family peptide modification chaperone [Tabrizicola sp.]|uniref:PqqD family peptide modification chaperone n=1 Tax=Tabrizicola sp. TaxID=2005166 RepID=UPI0027341F17|nr:PqqD family peptide modification chaperone [Tabrizicola sp.]MDP3197062.1 PqqD family peptide modification chaperone [Tabrizicola sp.]
MKRDIFFQGVTAPLRLDGAGAILPIVAEIAAAWPYRLVDADLLADPFFTIRGDLGQGKLLCESHVEDRPAQLWDPVNAVCDAMASLAVALPLSDPHLICLHAAGVEMAGQLVVFPNLRRAGKSTLSVALARAGHPIFSDDVVPLSFPSGGVAVGHAMGIAPRLRLPLPDTLPADFRSWAEAMPGPRNRQYHYLPLPGQPAHGTRLPVGAFVLLDRRDAPTAARLTAVPPDVAMDALLHQNFTRDRHSGAVLEVVAATLAAAPVWQLTYTDLDEAVKCLEAGFAGQAAAMLPGGQEWRFGPAVMEYRPGPVGTMLSQREGCVERWIGDVLYLADPEGRAIQRMDPLAAAIWGMLEEPVPPEELEEALVEAFPDTPRVQISADIFALLAGLVEAGLLG